MFYSDPGQYMQYRAGSDLIQVCRDDGGLYCYRRCTMIHLHSGGQTLHVPEGWVQPVFSWNLDLNWSGIVPEANKKIADDGYSPVWLFLHDDAFKGVFAAGMDHAPNYDMQKILSSRSPMEASK